MRIALKRPFSDGTVAIDLDPLSLLCRLSRHLSSHAKAFARRPKPAEPALIDGHDGRTRSMSAAGKCYDNAVAETFFAALKRELVHGCAFEARSEAYDAIRDYIENYYNAKRRR